MSNFELEINKMLHDKYNNDSNEEDENEEEIEE